ncbi:MAG: 4-(cytidine 5'-diphospho)-2-C-methyl-D-erythritol kinase [Candidatus Omnitrophica bacterium]|nr:4-(cytidine 5'-diphospho)-2-C-methyl-D-erythritol kinase [Candidatus Omnitrophota bacterium]
MDCQQKPSLIKQQGPCRIKLICPAKINLYLNILGRYKSGFHKIETVVSRISLFDELTIIVNENPGIKMMCDDKTLANENNLCVKAALLLKKEFKIKRGFSFYLKKNIPIGAGLGGGSSCGASALIGIMRLMDINIPLERLYSLGKRLGSDVNFFLSESSFAYLWGRGEKVRPLNLCRRLNYFLVYPGQRLSTKLVYKNTKVKLTNFLNNVKILLYALKRKDFALLQYSFFNVLEEGAFSASPVLREHKSFLRNLRFKMTGSGSAFFALIKNKRHIQSLRKAFCNNWRVLEVHTM